MRGADPSPTSAAMSCSALSRLCIKIAGIWTPAKRIPVNSLARVFCIFFKPLSSRYHDRNDLLAMRFNLFDLDRSMKYFVDFIGFPDSMLIKFVITILEGFRYDRQFVARILERIREGIYEISRDCDALP